VLKDVGVEDNGAKARATQKYPLHFQGQNYGKCIYELKDHVGEKALNSNLSLFKLEPIKKIPHVSFPNCIIRKCLSLIHVSLCHVALP